MGKSLTIREKYLVWVMFVFLLISGIFHISLQNLASEVLANTNVIRVIGLVVTILGVLHLISKKRYFKFIGIFVTWHGVWRLFAPASSIATQESTYPRWVHGILILVAAAIFLLVPYKIYNQENKTE